VLDWADRIEHHRSMVPALPLFLPMAEKAVRIFQRLRTPDIVGAPRYGDICGDWVLDLVAAIFGSYNPETRRRMIREFFLLVPKKNGKSSIAAAIILTASILNERPDAELLLVAPTKEIANIAFKQAAGIIRLDPALSKLFLVRDNIKTIENRNEKIPSFIKIKSADKDVITGSKATYILVDETHVFATKAHATEVFMEIRGSLASRPDGFLLQISSQSKSPPAGVFRAELAKARAVRDGKLRLPLLPIIYELPIAISKDGGWKNRKTWSMVNPNLGRSVDPAYLADEITVAEREGPAKLALIASQHFNVEIGLGLHADRWPGALYWEHVGDSALTFDRILAESEVCTIGIDGGGLDDLFALSIIGRRRDTHEWLQWAHAWAQPDVLARRPEIAPRLRDFAAAGELTICSRVEQDVIEAADICEHLFEAGMLPAKFGIGLDAFGIATLLDELAARDMAGDLLLSVGQGWKLQSAVLTVPRKLKDGSFRHGAQGLMAWAVGNARTELKGSNYLVTKQAAGAAKIDPLMAMFNAAMLMFLNPQCERPSTPWDINPDYRMSA